ALRRRGFHGKFRAGSTADAVSGDDADDSFRDIHREYLSASIVAAGGFRLVVPVHRASGNVQPHRHATGNPLVADCAFDCNYGGYHLWDGPALRTDLSRG